LTKPQRGTKGTQRHGEEKKPRKGEKKKKKRPREGFKNSKKRCGKGICHNNGNGEARRPGVLKKKPLPDMRPTVAKAPCQRKPPTEGEKEKRPSTLGPKLVKTAFCKRSHQNPPKKGW